MPLAEDLDTDDGVEVLKTKRVRRGNRMVTQLRYSTEVNIIPSSADPNPDVPSVPASNAANLSMNQPTTNPDNMITEPQTSNIQPFYDYSLPEVKKTMTQQQYLRQFETRKKAFIRMLLARNALPKDSRCTSCGNASGFYRCQTCHLGELQCRGCIRHVHRHNPFHRIEHWNGDFFQSASLWQVGVRLVIPNSDSDTPCRCVSYQMSILEGQEIAKDATRASRVHSFQKRKESVSEEIPLEQGNEANNPEERFHPVIPDIMEYDMQPGAAEDDISDTLVDSGSDNDGEGDDDNPPDDNIYEDDEDGNRLGKGIPRQDSLGNRFVVIIDSSGMHHLPMVVCKCSFRSVEQHVLDCVFVGLIPASYKTISTIFTESCLNDFRLSNLEAKLTPNRYHNILQRKTNNAFPQSAPSRYGEMRRMTREWRSMQQEIAAGIHIPGSQEPLEASLAEGTEDSPATLESLQAGNSTVPVEYAQNAEVPAPGIMTDAAGPLRQRPWVSVPSASTEILPDDPQLLGIDPAMLRHTKPALALFCPACPQPGVNLPTDWRTTIDKWLLARQFTMDGNFSADHVRQKGGNTDLWLLDGQGHFCERTRYQAHLGIAKEMRTNAPCEHNFRAIGLGSLTRTDCDVTGIGAAACARHGCFCPASVVDLQKGERQMNMDYCLCQAILNTNVPPGVKVFTWYDIWCQYAVHFLERVSRNPFLSIPDGLTMDGGIGLFHVHGHADQCFHRFAPYFIPGTGIVDGEVLETLWSVLNHISRSTRSATLAHREEILNDSMNDSNWKKWVKMVPRLVKKYKTAVQESAASREYWDNLSNQAGAEQTSVWQASIERAEEDRTGVNATSMDIMHSNSPSPKGKVAVHFDLNEKNPECSADTAYIAEALRLEEEQLKIGIAIARMGAYPNPTQKKDVTAKRNALLKKIQALHGQSLAILGSSLCQKFPEQRPYIPVFQADDEDGVAYDESALPDANGARPAVVYNVSAGGSHAELIFLMLPSGVPGPILKDLLDQDSSSYSPRFAALCSLELQLRIGQANDALQDIRSTISRISFQYTKNYRNADRTMIKTRSRTAIDNLHKGVSHCRRVYNLCRERMVCLGISEDQLALNFRVITNDDVRVSTAIRSPNERGASSKKLSWIFQTEMERRGEPNEEAYLWEYMRVHWLRARAMALRWNEELTLVQHEMLWTWICFQRKHLHWRAMGQQADVEHLPGHASYARKESYMWQKMAEAANAAFSSTYPGFVARL